MKQLAKICIIGSLDRDAEDYGDKNMNSLYFTYETCDSLKPFSLFFETEYGTQNSIRNRNFKDYPSWFTFSTQGRIGSFHTLFCRGRQRNASRIIAHVYNRCAAH